MTDPTDDDDYAPITPAIKNAVAWMCALHEVERWGDWIEQPQVDAITRSYDAAMEPLDECERDTVAAIFWGNFIPPCAVSYLRVSNGIWGEDQYWSAEVEEAMGRKAFTLERGNSR